MALSHDWYGRDWKILRSQLCKLCLNHAGPLLDGFSGTGGLDLDSFFAAVEKDISDRISMDELGLWQHCLPLLVRREWLVKELEKDRQALAGNKASASKGISPDQALARKLCLFFERNRRLHVADELGVSEHQVKTWERLDRISRRLCQDRVGNRCVEEHFTELADYIRCHHGHDRNLPRRTPTIRGYFFRFSDDCVEHIEDRENSIDTLSLQQARELLTGVGMIELVRCLQNLEQKELEIIDMEFGLGMTKIQYLSRQQYLRDRKMTRSEFAPLKKRAVQQLRHCLETGLAARQGRYV